MIIHGDKNSFQVAERGGAFYTLVFKLFNKIFENKGVRFIHGCVLYMTIYGNSQAHFDSIIIKSFEALPVLYLYSALLTQLKQALS